MECASTAAFAPVASTLVRSALHPGCAALTRTMKSQAAAELRRATHPTGFAAMMATVSIHTVIQRCPCAGEHRAQVIKIRLTNLATGLNRAPIVVVPTR